MQLENGDVTQCHHEIGHNFGLLHANRYFTKAAGVEIDDADK